MAFAPCSTCTIVGVASRATSCHVTHLSGCCFNLMNILLESVSNLCRVLFTLTVGANMTARIACPVRTTIVVNLAGRLVYRRLIL